MEYFKIEPTLPELLEDYGRVHGRAIMIFGSEGPTVRRDPFLTSRAGRTALYILRR